MAKYVNPIPEGYRTVTPQLTVRGATSAIEFYRKAFGAEVLSQFLTPDGATVAHAELKIGDSLVLVMDEMPTSATHSPQSLNGCTGMMHLYVDDVDASFKRALDAGAKVQMALQDMFWGDRYGVIVDPFGHVWGLATHKEDVSKEEMDRRGKEFFAQQAKQQKR